MKEFNSYELTDFNLDGEIDLGQKFGCVKIDHSKDGKIILSTDTSFNHIDQTQPTKASFFRPDSTLGFVIDIGIQKEKQIYNTDLSFPMKQVQSTKKISQSDFDGFLFEKIGMIIDSYFKSGDPLKEKEAMKLQFNIDEYNNARLMYPNFYSASYLNLMSIIDALAGMEGAYRYAYFVAKISPKLNEEILLKLVAVAYGDRIIKAEELFSECLDEIAKNPKDNFIYNEMRSFNKSDRVIYSCFYSAYQYRNKYVHEGFPFPSIVIDAHGVEDDSGTAYIKPVLAQSWSRFYRPQTGLQEGDLIDIHNVVKKNIQDFQDTYFLLLPSWHFVRKMAKEAILNKINFFDTSE